MTRTYAHQGGDPGAADVLEKGWATPGVRTIFSKTRHVSLDHGPRGLCPGAAEFV